MSETYDASFEKMIAVESTKFQQLTTEINKVVIGNKESINFILTALLCNGHVLLEGVPGVAKTTIIKTIAQALGLSFKRIQFTPDLLPSDLIGTLIYNQKTLDFETKKGPIFANLILADEINRAPAKVQAALLEAMQEHQVTIGNTTFKLEEPFLVFATQNPIEQEGTYRLPEAQVDRFLFKVMINYPSLSEEKEVVRSQQKTSEVTCVLQKSDILAAQASVQKIFVDEKVLDYMLHIVFATRDPQAYNLGELKHYISCGASPRASLALHHAARAQAFLKKRQFVTPDDVKAIVYPVLRHRLALTYQADAEGVTAEQIIAKILASVQAP